MPSPPTVAVIGCGALGRTVVLAALQAGSRVRLYARGTDERRAGLAGGVHSAIGREIARGRLGAETGAAMGAALQVTGELADLHDVDVLLESVTEDLATKRSVIAAVEDVVHAKTLIASTTSTIPAAALAEGARHPERIVVAHYVWPAHRMPLVEVAKHAGTSPAAARQLDRLLAGQHKQVLTVADRPGFLITRALFAYWDAALDLVRHGATPAGVDGALERFGWPMGPLRVMQGTSLTSAVTVYGSVAGQLDRPYPALAALGEVVRDLVAAGADAAGLGFDDTLVSQLRAGVPALQPSDGPFDRPSDRQFHGPFDDAAIVDRAVGALAHEVDRAVTAGVVSSWAQAGTAIELAYGFPRHRGDLRQWARAGSRSGLAADLLPA